MPQRRLHAALGQARLRGDGLVAGAHALRFLAERAVPEPHVHHERGRGFVVAGEVAQQRLEDVAVEADCLDIRYSSDHYSNRGFQNIVFQTDDVRKTYEELKAKGVEFTQEPKTEPWGTSAMFKDSEGNVFLVGTK